jgi:uncharacterized protein
MTDLTPIPPQGRQLIQGYGGGRFRVAGTAHEGSILVFAEITMAWPVADFDDITAESLATILARAAEIDVLIVGCGSRFRAPDPVLTRHLAQADIALEMMDTGAACRTYNLLLSDDRRVAAALIAVE